jgi:hypothetical protein
MDKIKLSGVFAGALLLSTSIAVAQVAPAHVPAPTHAPVVVPVEAVPTVAAPEPAPAPVEAVPEPAPVVVAVPEPAPAPLEVKPAEPAKAAASVTKISLYGFAQLNAIWEDGVTSISAPNWSLTAPRDNSKGGSRTLLNVNHSRIGINFSDSPTEGGTELSGKIEADFNNNANRNPNGATANTTVVSGVTQSQDKVSTTTVSVPGASAFRIRHSYGQVKFSDLGLTILFGQTGNVFSPRDPSILSEGTMNYSGNIGSSRVPQIRLTQVLGPAEIAVAAVDDRGASAPKAPSVQGRLGLKTSADWADAKQNLELGVSGHFAHERNTDITEHQVNPKVPKSWSFNADLNLPIIDVIGLSGEFFYGQNLKNYANGSLGLDKGNTNSGTAGVKSIGYWANLGIKLPASLALNGGLGAESISNDDDIKDGAIKSNTGIFANLRYNFIPSAFIGIEYWHISTDYKFEKATKAAEKEGAINRVELAFNYSFK